MHEHYDLDEILELAQQPRYTAALIKEELGLGISVRRVQQIINAHLGRRPSRQSIQRRDVLRSRVMTYMEAQGLDRYYCYLGHRTIRPCAIRELRRDDDLGSLVFVCDHEATTGDV